MKVLLINGSPREHGCTDTALCEMVRVFEENGVETELLWIGKGPIAGCTACGACAKNGRCIYDDQVNGILARLDTIDGIVVGSPVYYAGVSGQITSFLDRLFYAGGGRMKGKPAASVVSCRRGGASAAFEIINKYFMMTNMPVVTSQYWNQVHGNTPDEVRQDLEGLQTVRTLAQNMTWLLRCIEAGKAAGVPEPVYEPKVRTNFIR
ncbi:MAG: flavodoxin family protein [Clostridia bacterium]|nr:flavodoxin family protein [Clostridia bacterium]